MSVNIFLSEARGEITKCCKNDEVLDYYHQMCVPNPETDSSSMVSSWLPPREILASETSRPTGQFNIQYSDFPYMCDGRPYQNFQLFSPLFTDGTAVTVTEEGIERIPYACLDRNLGEDGVEVEEFIWVLVCDHDDGNMTATGVVPRMDVNETTPGDSEAEECEWEAMRNLYSFLSVVSITCLLATAYVYIKVKETERIQGKIILANVVATIFVNLYFLIVYNFDASNGGRVSCIVLGYFGYFASLTMFSWMSVMCFNLVKTFIKLNLSQGSQKKFLIYFAFGIGFPLILSLTAGILQVRYKSFPHL